MGTSETNDRPSSPAMTADLQARLKYEPPAVAWEETFDPVSATVSECQEQPTMPGC